MSVLLIWIGVGIVFLIMELLTAIFYGLALAIASFVVAGYVAITGEQVFGIAQGIIFLVIALLFSFFLPKFFNNNVKDTPQGLDVYIGGKYHVQEKDGEYKIFLDGIPYNATSKTELQNGDFVTIISRNGAVFEVEKL